jgi:hypothetical protein
MGHLPIIKLAIDIGVELDANLLSWICKPFYFYSYKKIDNRCCLRFIIKVRKEKFFSGC